MNRKWVRKECWSPRLDFTLARVEFWLYGLIESTASVMARERGQATLPYLQIILLTCKLSFAAN